jgi:hypothetical protein
MEVKVLRILQVFMQDIIGSSLQVGVQEVMLEIFRGSFGCA